MLRLRHRRLDASDRSPRLARTGTVRTRVRRSRYNPFGFDLHDDPYATYRRLRDEAPAYWNPDLEFWALSRFDDVLAGFRDLEHVLVEQRRRAREPGSDRRAVPPDDRDGSRPSTRASASW